jgi:hypothetical protein
MCCAVREKQLFAGYFTTMSVSQNIRLYDSMVGQQKNRKAFGSGLGPNEVISWHLSGGSEENHEKPQSV